MPSNSNTYRLAFTREFIKGTFAGLTQEDGLTFPTIELAEEYLEDIKKGFDEGVLDYKIIFYCILTIQNYDKSFDLSKSYR